ncbi:MAG: FAD-dependent monooxygenase [Victivallaceae bacterium]
MTDVVIIGANPTGLILATGLLKANIDVKIIDHRPSPNKRSDEDRRIPINLSPPSLELLHAHGLFNETTLPGQKLDGITYFWNKRSVNIDIEKSLNQHSLSAFPFCYASELKLLEDGLIENFENFGGVIHWETRPVTMVDNNLFIEKIDPKSTFEHREVHTPKFILACEADNNPHIKDIMKYPSKTKKMLREVDVFPCSSDKRIPRNRFNVFALSGCANHFLFPEPHGNEFLLWSPSHKKKPRKNREKLFSLLGINPGKKRSYGVYQMLLPHQEGNILFIGRFFNNFFLSTKTGINLNLLSAFNLLWKIIPVLKNESTEKLIASYENEISSAYKTVANMSFKHSLLLAISRKLFPTLAYWGFKGYNFLCSSKNTPNRFSICYSPGEFTKQSPQNKDIPGPKPGEYASNLLLNEGEYLLDGADGSRHLLIFFKNHPGLIEALKEEYGEHINIKVAKSQTAKDLYYANENSLYIIRPDRYIGYRSASFKIREIVAYFLKIFPNLKDQKN